jgi:hypothetical protein
VRYVLHIHHVILKMNACMIYSYINVFHFEELYAVLATSNKIATLRMANKTIFSNAQYLTD